MSHAVYKMGLGCCGPSAPICPGPSSGPVSQILRESVSSDVK